MSNAAKRYYTPRTLLEIRAALSDCKDSREALILKAKYATVLATNSEAAEALQIVADLRRGNQGFEPRLSAWLMYCDGVLIHCDTLNSVSALDRFKRSYIFASAIKDHELASSCAAWMGHCYFALGEMERTAEHLKLAFDWARPVDSGALARASLVLADALSWAGSSKHAVSWYSVSRGAASAFGDLAMQNAAIYNSAAFRVSNLTLSQIEGKARELDARLATTEVESASTLNTLIGNNNSPELIPLLNAELCAALGRFKDALVFFEQYFSYNKQLNLARYQPKLISQKAYCDAAIGNMNDAATGYELALSMQDQEQDLDDSAVLLYRCSQIAALVGDHERSKELQDGCNFSLNEFRGCQTSAQELFEGLLALESVKRTTGQK